MSNYVDFKEKKGKYQGLEFSLLPYDDDTYALHTYWYANGTPQDYELDRHLLQQTQCFVNKQLLLQPCA